MTAPPTPFNSGDPVNIGFGGDTVTLVEGATFCLSDGRGDVLAGLRDGLLKSESVSPYLLTYLSGHFVDTEAPVDDFMQLVSEDWMKAWLAFEGGYRGFSRDVQRAVQVLAARKPPNYRSLLVRCALFLTSLGSSGSALSDRLWIMLSRKTCSELAIAAISSCWWL